MMNHRPGTDRQRLLTEYPGFQTNPKGEGYHGSTSVIGAEPWTNWFCTSSANSGLPHTEGFGPQPRSPVTPVHKRSFIRACKRAVKHGSAGYHGQMWHWTDFPKSLISKVTSTMKPETQPCIRTVRRSGTRFTILHWNPGGFSQAKFLEFKWWLQTHPVDFIVLSETRWSFENTWHDDSWAFIHSAAPEPKSGGLLVMISKRIAQPHMIGYDPVIPGRLLHIRIHFEARAVDILAAYQHVCHRTAQSKQNRHSFWTQLDTTLHKLPGRNLLLCAGDFNCNIPECKPWTGPNSFRWKGKRVHCHPHEDHECFLTLMRRHGLRTLNTWNERTGPTFLHGSTATRIDYVLTRLSTCDGLANHAMYLADADFVPLNLTHHIPVQCSVRTNHTLFQVSPQMTSCTYQQRSKCRNAFFQDSIQWGDLRSSVQQAVQMTWSEQDPDRCLLQLHEHVQTDFHRLFPKTRRVVDNSSSDFRKIITTKWDHKQLIRRLSYKMTVPTIHTIFQAWFHWSCYCRLQSCQHKQARLDKKAKFQELCQEVTIAASRHDAHAMFAIINKYTSKRPLIRTKLRTPDGHIADQYQSHALTAAFVRETWQGPPCLQPAPAIAPGVPFTEDELVQTLSKVHLNKSVAQPFLPAAVWRSATQDLAALLMHHLTRWWGQTPPQLPQCWRDAWLFFLPKPGKANTHPAHLRPISLMEPLGKIIMSLLATRLKQCICDHLCYFPHFGFLPHRAATDAVNRVATHCREIRVLVMNGRRTVFHQIEGRARTTASGGISLFLDLTRAFDSVDRHILFQHMNTLPIPSNLVDLIRMWHEQTHYNLVFRGNTYPIPVGKGVRQGCTIAPLLWLIYMDKILKELAALTGPEWIMQCVTIYADDLHIGCRFMSAAELRMHVTNMGHLLDVLHRLKLTVSCSKTFVILAVTGTNPRAALKSFVQRNQKGTKFRIACIQGSMDFPLQSTGSYLGVTMSYRMFEDATWTKRQRAGWSAFQRLLPWLKTRSIPLTQRLYLWHTCIHTVITYGLLAVQMTPKVLHEYQSVVFRMLRGVIGDHAYCTHHTHQQALQAFAIPEPLDLLLHLAMGLHQRLQRRLDMLTSNDFLHRLDWTHLQETMHLLQTVRQTTSQVPIAVDPTDPLRTQAIHVCPVCEFKTTSIPNLRRHMTVHHQQPQLRTAENDALALAVQGKPQCSNCFRMFTTWRQYFIHLQRDCCQATKRACAALSTRVGDMLPAGFTLDHLHVATQPFWPVLKNLIVTQRWHDLGPEHEIGEHLTHTCMVCGIWNNRFQELHSHYRLHHSELLPGGVAKGAQLTDLLGMDSPCLLCSAEFQRIHSCPATLQVGILHILANHADEPDVSRRCDICRQSFNTMQALYRHLFDVHELTLNDWCQARDSRAEGDVCAHCGLIFDSKSGLRRHITEGRCMEFDPDAPTQTCDVEATWGHLLRQGHIHKGSLTAIQRLRLTTQCQLCSMTYDRQGDLVAHLLQTHGSIWQRSQQTLRYLLQVTYPQYGCMCNPMTNEFSVSHVCVGARQIAMLFEQSTVELLVPTQFQEVDLRRRLAFLAREPWIDRLIQTLVHREFATLWTSPDFLALLCSRCLLCGEFHAPAKMMHHLLLRHPAESQRATQILFQITACMKRLQAYDYQCSCCGLVFNLPATTPVGDPDRLAAQSAHFDFCCPVARQVGCLLLPLNGLVDGGPTRSGADEQPPGTGSPPAGHPQERRSKRRGPPQQAPQARRIRRPASRADRSGGHGSPSEGGGAAGAQPRAEPEQSVQAGLLRFVCLGGPTRGHSTSPGLGTAVEVAADHTPDSTGFTAVANHENVLAGRTHEGIELPSQAAQQQQGWREALGHGPPEGHPMCSGGLELSEMVTRSADIGSCPESQPSDAAHAQTPGHRGRAPPAQFSCGAIPQPESSGTGDSLVPASDHEGPGTLDLVGQHHPQYSLELDGNDGQAAQPADVEAGATTGGNPAKTGLGQGSWQGEAEREATEATMTELPSSTLRHRLLQLTFQNNGTLCYANSAILSFMWASLSRTAFNTADWGALSAPFREMLKADADSHVNLNSMPWFQSVVAQWIDRHSQADSAEFTHRLLSWGNVPVVSNTWRRLVLIGEKVTPHDSGARHMPITLQLDPSLITHDEISLNALIRYWHEELGMTAGLEDASDLLVLHLDRFVQAPSGRLRKLTTAIRFCWTIQIPFLRSDASCHWEHFQVIAAFAHHGDTASGHYQTILRTFPDLMDMEDPALWMFCDDNRLPEKRMTIPEGFEAGATCFWLCKASQVELHKMSIPRTPTSAVLHMLQAQPNQIHDR